MKRNLACVVLIALLFVSASATVLLSVKFFFGVKELQAMQMDVVRASGTLNVVQALANESVEYSRRNPAIDPLLYQFDVKPRGSATNQPATSTPLR